jgi:two-component system response regulator
MRREPDKHEFSTALFSFADEEDLFLLKKTVTLENPMNSTEEKKGENLLIVLMADDDEDDYLLVKSAFEAGQNKVDLRWVENGQNAMDYLLHSGKYMAHESAPRLDLVLLDLMMPLKDGLETLKEIKGHRNLEKIPVVLLTSSKEHEHKSLGLMLGADSFITKPHDFEEMVKILGALHEHYFGIIRLPFCCTGTNR